MARVSGRSRFCHYCGTPILSAQAASPETGLRCPSCPELRPLASRRLGHANVAVFECGHCGGLWVEKEVFEVMAERARAGGLPEPLMGSNPASPASLPHDTEPGGARAYRPCVLCGALMNRRNYGRKSGVIVDVCSRHGIWFDLHELDGLLRWIRQGGEERVQVLAAEEERQAAREKALAEGVEPLHLTAEDRRREIAAGSRLGAVLAFLMGIADLRQFFGDD
jgi:Zn-finger nucleic acid-binding protein